MKVINNLIVLTTGERIPVEKILAYQEDSTSINNLSDIYIKVCVEGGLTFSELSPIKRFDEVVAEAWRNAKGKPNRTKLEQQHDEYLRKELFPRFARERLVFDKTVSVSRRILFDNFCRWKKDLEIQTEICEEFAGRYFYMLLMQLYGDRIEEKRNAEGKYYSGVGMKPVESKDDENG